MANRYWVGGTGNWDAASTTNWSASSGGAGGASIPTAADNVIFDVNSGSNFTVTINSASRLCLDLTVTGVTNMTLAGTQSLSIAGSLSLPASGLIWTASGIVTFTATTAKTVTTNGVTIASPMVFNGSAGSWTLQTAFTSTTSVTLTTGTLALNNFTLTAASFSSASATTRNINYGTSGSIVLTGTGTVWNMGTVTGFTYSGTSNVRLTNSGALARSITGGGTSAAQAQNFYITAGTSALNITGNFNDLDFTGFSGSFAQSTNNNTAYGNIVFSATMTTNSSSGTLTLGNTSGTKTITSNGITLNIKVTRNGVGGTTQFVGTTTFGVYFFTLTNGTLDLNSQTHSFGNFAFTTGTRSFINGPLTATAVTQTSGTVAITTSDTIVCSGLYTHTAGALNIADGAVIQVGAFNSSGTGVRSIAFNTTGELRITGSGTIWNTSTTTSFTYTGTSNVRFTYAGAAACTISAGALSATQAQNFYITAGTYSLTLTSGGIANKLDFTGFSGTYAQAATTFSVRDNLTFSSTMVTTTTTGYISMIATAGTKTITTNGITLNCGFNFNGVGGTFQLADTFTQNATSSFIVTNGTVDFNNQSYTIGILTFVSGTNSMINYGASITAASIVQTSGNVTLGAGLTLLTNGSYTLTAGTLTLSNSFALSVSAFLTTGTGTRAIAFGTGSIELKGSGTVWDSTTPTNFSYTGASNVRLVNTGSTATTISSGGMTAAQALNFYVTAGTYTLTYGAASTFNNLDFTGFSGTFSQPSLGATIFGNLILSATMATAFTGSPLTGSLSFAATSGTRTITTNGVQVNLNIYFNGVGGTFQLADNFTQNSVARLSVTNGTVDFNNKTISIGQFHYASGTNSYINYGGSLTPASIYHDSGTITVGTGTMLSTTGSYTFVSGTITINNSVTLSVGSFGSPYTNTRAIAFGTGSITTTGTGTVWSVTGTTGLSYTGTPTVIIDNATSSATTVSNTATAASAFDFDFISGTYSLTLATGSSWRTLDFTGFTGTLAMAATTHTMYGNLVLGAGMATTGTAGSALFSWISTAGTRTITSNGVTANFEISVNGAGQVVQLADAFITGGSSYGVRLIAGTFDLASYSTSIGRLTVQTGTHAITNGTINCATVTHSSGNLAIGTGYLVVASGAYTLTAGSITINNGVTLSVGSMSSANTNTRSVAFGTGNITTTGTGTVWNVTGTTGLSYTGTPTVIINNPTATATTVYNTATSTNAFDFDFISGTYTLSLSSGSSWRTLDFTGFTGTLALAATSHNVYGNLVLGTGMSTTGTAGSAWLSWVSTAGTRTITTNGVVVNFGITLNGVGQTLQLSDALVQGSTYTFAYTNGTFDLASYSTSLGIFTISTGTHAITNGALNCETVTHTSGDLSVGTGYNVVASGTYTFAGGTITINDGVDLSVGAFSSSTTATRSIAFGTGSLSLTRSTGGVVLDMTTITNFSYTGTSNVNVSTNTSNATSISPSSSATAAQAMNFNITTGTYSFTITASHVVNNLNFTGFSGSYDQASNTVIVYGNLTFSSTMTGSSTGGQLSMSASSGTRTVTCNGATIGNTITFNGTGGTFQLVDTFSQTATAKFRIANGTVDFNNQSYTLGILEFLSGTKSYINYGGTLSAASIIHTSGTVTTGTGALLYTAGIYTFTAGTLTINDGVDLTVGAFSSPGTSTRVLAFGTGRVLITATGSTTPINMATTTGFSYTGTSNLTVDNATVNDLTITTGSPVEANALNINVISGTYTAYIQTCTINNLNFTGFSGTLSMLANTCTLYGNLTLSSTMSSTATAGTNSFAWVSTAGTRTITTNGAIVGFGIHVNGIGQTVQLADAFTQSAGQLLTLTSGTLDINSMSVSAGILTIVSGTHAIINGTLGCSAVTHTSGDLSIGTGYLVECSGTYTFTAGTITINDDVSLKTGAISSNNTNTRVIAFGSAGSIDITGNSMTVCNLATTTGFSTTGTSKLMFSYAGSTGTRTIATGSGLTGGTALRLYITGGSDTITFTTSMTAYTVDFTGFSGTWTNIAITMSGSLTLSPTMTTGPGSNSLTFSYTTGTRTITSNGVTVNFPIISNNNVGTVLQFADTFVQNSSSSFRLSACTLDINAQSVTVGVLTVSTSGSHPVTNGTLTAASVTHSAGDLSVITGVPIVCTGAYTFTGGTITINDGCTLSTGSFSSSNTGVRSIAYNTSGVLSLTGSGQVWNTSTVTNFAYTGTSDVRLDYAGSTPVSISTGPMSVAQAQNIRIAAGTYSFAISSSSVINNLSFSGFYGEYTQGSDLASIYGNLTFANTMTYSTTSGYLSLIATSGTQTITTNGSTIGCSLAFNGVGGTFQLTDTFTQTSTASFILNNGTVDFNSQTYTLGILTFVDGTKSYINYGGTLSGASIMHTSGTVTLDTGALVATAGLYTFTTGTININNGVSLSVGSYSSYNNNYRNLVFSVGSKITTTGYGSVWYVGGASGFTYSGTPSIYINNSTSNSASIANLVTSSDLLNFYIASGTYSLSIAEGSIFNNIDFTGFTGSLDMGVDSFDLYGNITLGSGTTSSATSGSESINFLGTSTHFITSNGAVLNVGINIGSGTVRHNDAFTQGPTQTFTISGTGVFIQNTYSVTVGVFKIVYVNISASNLATALTSKIFCASVIQEYGYTMSDYCRIESLGEYKHTSNTLTLYSGSPLYVGSYTHGGSTATKSIAFSGSSLYLTGYGLVWDAINTGWSYTGTSYVGILNSTTNPVSISSATVGSLYSVYFVSQGSAAYTLSILDGTELKGLNVISGTLDLNTANVKNYSGLSLAEGTVTAGTTGTMIFNPVSGGSYITTSDIPINFNVTLDSTYALTLVNDLPNLTGGYGTYITISPQYKFTLIRGTVNISDSFYGSNKIFKVGYLDITTDYSHTTKSINFTRGYIQVTGESGTIITSLQSAYTGSGRVHINSAATSGTLYAALGSNTGASTYAIQINTGSYTLSIAPLIYTTCSSLTFASGFTGVLNIDTSVTIKLYSSLTLSSGMSTSGAGTVYFANGGTLNTNGVSVSHNIYVYYSILSLGSALTMTGSITHEGGTFTTSNYSVTTQKYTIISGTKTINLGSSVVTLTGAGSAWDILDATGLTMNAGTSTISLTSSSSKTFVGASKTYYKVRQAGAGQLTISGNNTFNDITATYRPSTVTLTSGSTQTVSNFTLSGTSGNLVTLDSSTSGSPATLSKTSGTVDVSYLAIKDSTATGGATWNAPTSAGNVDNGGNIGWIFGAIVSAVLGNFFAFF